MFNPDGTLNETLVKQFQDNLRDNPLSKKELEKIASEVITNPNVSPAAALVWIASLQVYVTHHVEHDTSHDTSTLDFDRGALFKKLLGFLRGNFEAFLKDVLEARNKVPTELLSYSTGERRGKGIVKIIDPREQALNLASLMAECILSSALPLKTIIFDSCSFEGDPYRIYSSVVCQLIEQASKSKKSDVLFSIEEELKDKAGQKENLHFVRQKRISLLDLETALQLFFQDFQDYFSSPPTSRMWSGIPLDFKEITKNILSVILNAYNKGTISFSKLFFLALDEVVDNPSLNLKQVVIPLIQYFIQQTKIGPEQTFFNEEFLREFQNLCLPDSGKRILAQQLCASICLELLLSEQVWQQYAEAFQREDEASSFLLLTLFPAEESVSYCATYKSLKTAAGKRLRQLRVFNYDNLSSENLIEQIKRTDTPLQHIVEILCSQCEKLLKNPDTKKNEENLDAVCQKLFEIIPHKFTFTQLINEIVAFDVAGVSYLTQIGTLLSQLIIKHEIPPENTFFNRDFLKRVEDVKTASPGSYGCYQKLCAVMLLSLFELSGEEGSTIPLSYAHAYADARIPRAAGHEGGVCDLLLPKEWKYLVKRRAEEVRGLFSSPRKAIQSFLAHQRDDSAMDCKFMQLIFNAVDLVLEIRFLQDDENKAESMAQQTGLLISKFIQLKNLESFRTFFDPQFLQKWKPEKGFFGEDEAYYGRLVCSYALLDILQTRKPIAMSYADALDCAVDYKNARSLLANSLHKKIMIQVRDIKSIVNLKRGTRTEAIIRECRNLLANQTPKLDYVISYREEGKSTVFQESHVAIEFPGASESFVKNLMASLEKACEYIKIDMASHGRPLGTFIVILDPERLNEKDIAEISKTRISALAEDGASRPEAGHSVDHPAVEPEEQSPLPRM